MKKLALLLTCFITAIIFRGQDNNFNRSPISVQSPDAAQFIRYGNIPVDYSTGIPSISIPLYTATCGGLSLPIDISYNASGIKVLDIASTVGLGWSLNVGGLVSRTIMGMDDQQNAYKPFLSSTDVTNALNYCHNNFTYNNIQNFVETVNQIFTPSTQQKESQSDRFFYSFNGRSGIFRTDYQTGVAKTVPYSSLKISTGINNAGPYKITAEDGTNYYFDKPEFSSTTASLGYYSSFYLTKIESADLTHVINIYYKLDDLVGQFIKNYEVEHRVEEHLGQNYHYTQLQDHEYVTQSYPVMPDSITSDNETILFEYVADRPDLRKSRLTKIKVLNRITREIIRVIELQHSYFGSAAANNRRLKLDNLLIEDNTSTSVQKYSFGYNSTPLPPYYNQVGMSEHHNVDYWGYYNAADDANLIPRELFDLGGSYFTASDKSAYGGNRNPNAATAQACILTEITYPTGGKTNFEYELNRVSNAYSYVIYNDGDFGGLRVKKITTTADATSAPIVKTYEYDGGVHTLIEPELYGYNTEYTRFSPGQNNFDMNVVNVESSVICSDPLVAMSTGSGPPVIYQYVKEYDGTVTNNKGYTEYIYDNSSLSYYILDPGSGGNPLLNGYYLQDFGIYKPQLKTKVFYGKDQTNTDIEVKREDYTYNNFNTGNFITGVKIQRNMPYRKEGDYAYYTDCDMWCSFGGYCQQGLAAILSYYYSWNTTAVLDVPLLVQKKETFHPSTGTGTLVTTVDYTYDLVTLQPIQETVTNSKGEIIISSNKYSKDFSPAEPYNTMVTRNILTPVVEQTVYKNTISSQNFLKSSKTNYDFWNGNDWSLSPTNIIVPRTIDTRSKDQPGYETRLRYYSYDVKGNLTTISKENDVRKTYLWGYNKSYPVAEIIGADYTTASSYVNQSILDNPTDEVSLRNHLNNLRNIPNAFITTYTYRPLIGMTSATDINGRTTFYVYDFFGRLSYIKDKDGKIIKKFCYNYAGQQEVCTVNTTSQWTTTGNYRCVLDGSGQNTGYQEREERDNNSYSATYNQTHWVSNGYNTTACPLPNNCNYSNCGWEGYHCVYGQCEQGYRVNTYSYYDYSMGQWVCVYHYEFSDGSWSSDYYEYSYWQSCNQS
jgi:hypothetical protein